MSQNKSKDALGDRMKGRFEDRCRFYLPRRTYTILRVDGKAFHSYTRDAQRPFDLRIQLAMQATARELCQQIQGAQFAFQQSDEISVLITDFKREDTHAWFDNIVQKMASVAASIATMTFNGQIEGFPRTALFDARVFTIPDYVEVENYFVWRQGDCEKNAIQMLCRSLYSHKQMHGKGFSAMNEMLFAKGINWAEYGHDMSCPEDTCRLLFKRGALVVKTGEGRDSNWEIKTCERWNTQEGRPQLVNLVPRTWPEDYTKFQKIKEELDPICESCDQPASLHSNGADDFSKCPGETISAADLDMRDHAGPRLLKDQSFDDTPEYKRQSMDPRWAESLPNGEVRGECLDPAHRPLKGGWAVGKDNGRLGHGLAESIGRIASVLGSQLKGQIMVKGKNGKFKSLGEVDVDPVTFMPVLTEEHKQLLAAEGIQL